MTLSGDQRGSGRGEVSGEGKGQLTKRLLVSSLRDFHCSCRLVATPVSEKLALVVP